MPELPAEPTDIEPPPKTADKLDIMSRNCSELKKSLAQLQAQMNGLNNAEKEKPAIEASIPTSAAVSANKKAKNKKNKAKPLCPHKERTVHAEMVATIKSVFAPTDLKVVDDTIAAADLTVADPIHADPIVDPILDNPITADQTALVNALNISESIEVESLVVSANENDSHVVANNDQDSQKSLEQNDTNHEISTENSTALLSDIFVTG